CLYWSLPLVARIHPATEIPVKMVAVTVMLRYLAGGRVQEKKKDYLHRLIYLKKNILISVLKTLPLPGVPAQMPKPFWRREWKEMIHPRRFRCTVAKS